MCVSKLRGIAALCGTAAAACYRPAIDPGAFLCGDGVCPDGFVCVADPDDSCRKRCYQRGKEPAEGPCAEPAPEGPDRPPDGPPPGQCSLLTGQGCDLAQTCYPDCRGAGQPVCVPCGPCTGRIGDSCLGPSGDFCRRGLVCLDASEQKPGRCHKWCEMAGDCPTPQTTGACEIRVFCEASSERPEITVGRACNLPP